MERFHPLRPDMFPPVELEPYEIQHEGHESHFAVLEKCDDEGDHGDDHSREDRDSSPGVLLDALEDRIGYSEADHQDDDLPQAQIEEDLILILHLYGYLVLHGLF